MSGSAMIGYGNGNDNVIWGTASTNVMSGGGGSDRLIGGGGADYFLFLSPTDVGLDLVTDFSRAEGDKIGIGATAFQFGQIVDGATFITGSAATQVYQQLIYNSAAGALYYDPDGTGAQAAFALAQFSGAPALAASDFVLV